VLYSFFAWRPRSLRPCAVGNMIDSVALHKEKSGFLWWPCFTLFYSTGCIDCAFSVVFRSGCGPTIMASVFGCFGVVCPSAARPSYLASTESTFSSSVWERQSIPEARQESDRFWLYFNMWSCVCEVLKITIAGCHQYLWLFCMAEGKQAPVLVLEFYVSLSLGRS